MTSNLNLQFYEDYNCNTLTIIDRSIYNPDIVVGCERLLITLPGFKHPITIEGVYKGFNIAFNTRDFKLTSSNILSPLSDGLYIVNYSICPNDDIYVEYVYLRQTAIYKKYFKKLCSLQLKAECEPNNEIKEKIKKLQTIETYLQASKALVEDCSSPERGLELMQYADKLLNKITDNCKTC